MFPLYELQISNIKTRHLPDASPLILKAGYSLSKTLKPNLKKPKPNPKPNHKRHPNGNLHRNLYPNAQNVRHIERFPKENLFLTFSAG